jgi:TolB-like protein/class 3 adenylate cyclase
MSRLATNDERRPATIFHADVEDYTGRMGRDARATVRAVKECRALVAVLVDEYGGRVVNEAGDSILAEFPGASNAVKCAVMVQEKMHALAASLPEGEALRLRVGVHAGYVIQDGEDIFGSDINIACRVQEQADAGGICLSKSAYDEVGPLSGVRFEDRGYQRLKHVADAVRLYRLRRENDHNGIESAPRELPRLALPKVPSIVVLPFQNLSGDDSKDYFSDGISGDVISDLSRFRELFVIGRASAFAYKHRAIDITQIGRELGVRYVLEGSVLMGRGRVRLQVTLVDATNAQVLWAERYDRENLDLFEVQEDLSRQLVGTLIGAVERREQLRLLEKGTENVAAYDLVLRGQQEFHGYNREANLRARALYNEAVRLDPTYARAYAGLSRTHNYDWRYHWSEDATRSSEISLELARQAVKLDEGDSRGHAELGWAMLYRQQLPASIAAYEMALKLNPNNADVMAMMADAVSYSGDPARAIEMVTRAKRLNPHFPDSYLWAEADALFALKRYDAVIGCIGQMRNPTEGFRLLAASYAHMDRMAEAREAAEEVLRRQPDFSVDHWVGIQPEADPAEREHFRQGLLKAGLK